MSMNINQSKFIFLKHGLRQYLQRCIRKKHNEGSPFVVTYIHKYVLFSRYIIFIYRKNIITYTSTLLENLGNANEIVKVSKDLNLDLNPRSKDSSNNTENHYHTEATHMYLHFKTPLTFI